MAHSLSAKKRVRQARQAPRRNRARKEVIKDQVKAFNVALAGGDMSKAEQELRNVVSRLDKVAAKGTLHKKTASRKRSRLARKLNAVRSGVLKPTVAVGGKAGHRQGRSAKAARRQGHRRQGPQVPAARRPDRAAHTPTNVPFQGQPRHPASAEPPDAPPRGPLA